MHLVFSVFVFVRVFVYVSHSDCVIRPMYVSGFTIVLCVFIEVCVCVAHSVLASPLVCCR